jgi:hypothetical protein
MLGWPTVLSTTLRSRKMTAALSPRPLPKVRAMPGVCPIQIRIVIGDTPTFAELLEWFYEVRDWGLNRGLYLTRWGIISWGASLYPFMADEWVMCEAILERLAPEDEET